MKTIKWKYVVLVIVSFLLGVGATYFYMKSILNRNNGYTVRIIDNCSASMATSQTLLDTCGEAYKVASSCASHLETCDIANTTMKLKALNDQRIASETRLNNLTVDLSNIVHEVTGR